MKNLKLKTIILLAAINIGVFGSVEAANWEIIQNKNNENIIEYIDKDSIQKINYNTKKAWIKIYQEGNTEENLLIAFTKDGKAKLIDYDKNNKVNPPEELKEWTNIFPDTYLEVAYNKVWTKKERIEPKPKNKWERKGEYTVERAVDRILNKTIGRIGW